MHAPTPSPGPLGFVLPPPPSAWRDRRGAFRALVRDLRRSFVLVGFLPGVRLRIESRCARLHRLVVTPSPAIQLTMAIVPIFIPITAFAPARRGDREAGVFEYVLGLPVGIGAWYFGRFLQALRARRLCW